MVTAMQSRNIHTASIEWAKRPDDQRFLSLEDLHAAVSRRKEESWSADIDIRDMRFVPEDSSGLRAIFNRPADGREFSLAPTHHAFTQLAGFSGFGAKDYRGLLSRRNLNPDEQLTPAVVAAFLMEWGIKHSPIRDNALVLAQSNGDDYLRAMTSVSYGRIWDKQVVEAVQRVNEDGRWVVPAASYTTTQPKRATTLYASDRDVFIFLVDPHNPIDVKGEQLFRGFITWNSEVGTQTFGLTTFLYRYVCDNRIIWGAEDVREIRIRHTGGAPERFAAEGARMLNAYAEERTDALVGRIIKAKETPVPVKSKAENAVLDWLKGRGLTNAQAKGAVERAVEEEGVDKGAQGASVWDIANGITAYARTVPFTDERIKLERTAGELVESLAS